MKVLVAAETGQPDHHDLETLVVKLENLLLELGQEVDIFRLPTILSPVAAMEYALAMGLLNLGPDADRLVTLGGHCHLLRHPAKIAMIHRQDRALTLLGGGVKHPDQAHIRTALIGALQSARRIVVPDTSASETFHSLTGVQCLVGWLDSTSREALNAWLD